MPEKEWKLVKSYNVAVYQCGLRAGQRLVLRKDLIIRDNQDRPTGEVRLAGEIFVVLHGAHDDPGVVFLRQSDGERHTWDDAPEIYDWFRVAEPEA